MRPGCAHGTPQVAWLPSFYIQLAGAGRKPLTDSSCAGAAWCGRFVLRCAGKQPTYAHALGYDDGSYAAITARVITQWSAAHVRQQCICQLSVGNSRARALAACHEMQARKPYPDAGSLVVLHRAILEGATTAAHMCQASSLCTWQSALPYGRSG